MPAKQLAVVTGASTGIGLELARCCAQAGFNLVIAADEPAIERVAVDLRRLGVSVEPVEVDLATTEGTKQWLGGTWPTASIIVRADWVQKHPEETQRVVTAMVETMHWIATHSASDIADNMPKDFVSNQLITKQDYVDALTKDKGQFLPDGMMPDDGPKTVLDVLKQTGKVKGDVDLSKTYTNEYVIKAKKELGYSK